MSEYVIEVQKPSGEQGIFKTRYKYKGEARISIATIIDYSKIKLFTTKERATNRAEKLESEFGKNYRFEVIPYNRIKDISVIEIEKKEVNLTHDNQWVCAPERDCDIWEAAEYYDTKEEAIEAGKEVATQWNLGNKDANVEDVLGSWYEDTETIDSFAVGQCNSPTISVDADGILEQIAEGVYDQCGECAEDYLDDVLDDHKQELENVILSWFEKHKYYPRCYSIGNIENVVI